MSLPRSLAASGAALALLLSVSGCGSKKKETAATTTPTVQVAPTSTTPAGTTPKARRLIVPPGDGHKGCDYLTKAIASTILPEARPDPKNTPINCSYGNAQLANTPRIQLFYITKAQVENGIKFNHGTGGVRGVFQREIVARNRAKGGTSHAVKGLGSFNDIGTNPTGAFADWIQNDNIFILFYYYGPSGSARPTAEQMLAVAKQVSAKVKK